MQVHQFVIRLLEIPTALLHIDLLMEIALLNSKMQEQQQRGQAQWLLLSFKFSLWEQVVEAGQGVFPMNFSLLLVVEEVEEVVVKFGSSTNSASREINNFLLRLELVVQEERQEGRVLHLGREHMEGRVAVVHLILLSQVVVVKGTEVGFGV